MTRRIGGTAILHPRSLRLHFTFTKGQLFTRLGSTYALLFICFLFRQYCCRLDTMHLLIEVISLLHHRFNILQPILNVVFY